MAVKESTKLTKLHKQIKPAFTEKLLEGIPEEERFNYRQLKVVPIELLVKADWNYKDENPAMSAKLNANLRRNGQIENVHIRLLQTGYYEVINGNHRLDEWNKIGRKTVLCYDHGNCSKEEAIRKCLETNETVFEAKNDVLATLVVQLTQHFGSDELLLTLPYDESEIAGFEALVNSVINPTILDKIVLPSGDKGEFQQITFNLHNDQAEMVEEAIRICKAEKKEMFAGEANNNANGNALAYIVQEYLQSRNTNAGTGA